MKRRASSQRNFPPMPLESLSSTPTVSKTVEPCQTTNGDRANGARSVPVDLLLLLRQSVAECGYTLDSLSAAMDDIDKGYLHRLLNGEKPLTLERLPAFPDDVEALFAEKYAEARGRIVVTPVTQEQAVRHLVSGLMGVLVPKARRLA